MKKFEYYSPTKIIFGSGAEQKLGTLVKEVGAGRVVIIYGGGSAIKSGLIEKVEGILKADGIEYISEGGVVPNPLLSRARQIIDSAKSFGADFVLAVGGGSVIDTAKMVAHGIANPDTDVWEFWTGKAVTKSTPIGAVLTISAAGSETSNSSVITNDEVTPSTKRGVTTEFNRCVFAIMNPELTMTLPVYQVGAGAADIFMHTIERYFAAILGNHLTDEIAEGLMRDVIVYGPKAVADKKDYEAMSELMWAGSVSHIGLTGLGAKGDTPRDGDWGCHQLGMAISALYDSTHGATLTAIFASWARYVMHENIARFAQYGRKGFGIDAGSDEEIAVKAIDMTNDFFASLGMPIDMTALLGHKPTDEELVAITDECTYGKSRKIGSFRVLDYDDILQIYKNATV